MKIIRLALDYFCYPIWHDDGDVTNEFGPIDPGTLPISQDLADSLIRWGEWFDRGLNMDDPANSPAMNPEENMAFYAMGEELLVRLRRELGTGFVVNRRF